MLNKNRRLNAILAFALLFVLLASTAGMGIAQAADQPKTLTFALVKGDIPTIDPALATDTSSVQVAWTTHPTLTRGLETDLSKLQLNIASKFVLAKDGKSVTYTLRKDIPWVMWDGKQVVEVKDDAGKPLMVKAQDFEYAIKRMLDPATASNYAYVYTTLIVGANDFNSSKDTGDKLNALRDAVGVKAVDDWTLKVDFVDQFGYAMNIMSMWNLGAVPKAAVDKFADKWTEPGNAWSYGPYVISEWKHDESMTMAANPFWPGTVNSPKPKIQTIVMQFVDLDASFNNYEAGTNDITDQGVPLEQLDRVKADPTMSKELSIAPSPGTYYYGFNVTKPPFDDVHARRAFSYAVDRQTLVDTVTKGGQEPAGWMCRPGLVACPTRKDSPNLGVKYDPEMAKTEWAAYLKDAKITADQVPPITLMFNQGAGHDAIAQAIQQMWQKTLGVKVDLSQQEWKVYLKTLETDSPQVWRLGWNQDYPDANNFLKDVFYSTSTQNYTKWKNADFDKLVTQAAKLTDTAQRLALYRQADEILVKTDAAIIPVYWYTRVELTKPYVVRTIAVGSGDERFEKWDIKAH